MKKRLLTIAALTFVLTANAQDNPLWMRYCAISPDGQTIAFCYKGDIYTVPANGGKATQLTTNAAHDTHPIWSPDSKKIAFASNRQGSMDIYIIDKEGGTPQRLTTHSANEFPVTFKDAEHILYLSSLMPDAADMTFPSGQFPQVYEISTEGAGRHYSPPCQWKTSASVKTENPYCTTTGKDTKMPGESIILHPSHGTSGCVS